ncbi:ATP-binding cassette domain-containing protein [Lapidilactobacillus wuchangensis]|uniref:ATP-binding cassette domain-containing protein n=1 Tax=Lapidilactobacillus wuchangensis TaxID=2486001 RepID=UPI000F78FA1C|nr:ABC transporter ATP-binding protein [Lapidilactobacillus wuchangensis]
MILAVNQLNFQFSKRQVIFNQADLQINQPGIYGLVAPNGSGKTTLFNLITHLWHQQSGIILLNQSPNSQQAVFQNISYCPSIDCLFPQLTGADHLQFIANARQIDVQQTALISQRLKITPFLPRRVREYSLGMKQRLLLTMSLLPETPIILLDEPFNGIDPTSLRLMRAELSVLATSRTVLIASHDLTELARISRGVYFLQRQQFTYCENSDQIDLELKYQELYE